MGEKSKKSLKNGKILKIPYYFAHNLNFVPNFLYLQKVTEILKNLYIWQPWVEIVQLQILAILKQSRKKIKKNRTQENW